MKKLILNQIQKNMAFLAKKMIDKHKPEIFAITGSIAKTSTKELIYAVLEKKYGSKINKSSGNLNTEIGLPLTIFGFKEAPSLWKWPLIIFNCWVKLHTAKTYPSFLILEMAADKPGDINYLCSIARPKYGLVTAVGPAHLINFKNVEAIAKEKSQLVANLPENGVAFLNQSIELVKDMSDNAKCRIEFFKSSVSKIAEEAARTVGKYFNIEENKIEQAIIEASKNNSRFEEHLLKDSVLLIDDAYNANPLSMQGAFENFAEVVSDRPKGRKIAILGDMLELGDNSDKYHKEIGQLARKQFDLIIGVGIKSKLYEPNNWFANVDSANQSILQYIESEDTILVKGSHGIRLQKMVANILAQKKLS